MSRATAFVETSRACRVPRSGGLTPVLRRGHTQHSRDCHVNSVGYQSASNEGCLGASRGRDEAQRRLAVRPPMGEILYREIGERGYKYKARKQSKEKARNRRVDHWQIRDRTSWKNEPT